MDATKFLPSTLPLYNPQVSSPSSTTRRRAAGKPFLISNAARGGRGSGNPGGDYGGGGGGGRLVDENMIVLRMRIQENKMVEMRNKPPSKWMEWEKKYYANNGYNEDVCEALGFLQNCLMNMRPALALGLVALSTLSLVMSTGVVFFHSIQMAKIIIHLGFNSFHQ